MDIQERRARCEALAQQYYAGVPTREEILDRAVLANLRSDHRLLDAGCGVRAPLLRQYARKTSFAVGVDLVLPSAERIDHAALVHADLESIPFRDGTFDLIVSRSVIEHLEHPGRIFLEFGRLLRSGGKVIFTTPNKYYYSCIVARVIPFRLKDVYMKRVFADGYDHFPVYYRANTVRAFARIARMAGLRLRTVQAIRHYPFYLMFSPFLFRLGILYDRLITALRVDALQSTWLVVMEKG